MLAVITFKLVMLLVLMISFLAVLGFLFYVCSLDVPSAKGGRDD